mgnify:CR=1 FL=1
MRVNDVKPARSNQPGKRPQAAEIADRVADILKLVQLEEFAKRKPHQLSGGQKQRVALARALALDPQILFYDEPSAGLDPVTSAEIDQLIIDLTKKMGVTSVVVTHEMDSAFTIADRITMLDKGRILMIGTPEELKKSDNKRYREFIKINKLII